MIPHTTRPIRIWSNSSAAAKSKPAAATMPMRTSMMITAVLFMLFKLSDCRANDCIATHKYDEIKQICRNLLDQIVSLRLTFPHRFFLQDFIVNRTILIVGTGQITNAH